jgi:membrane fusion protein (multidrug efflux system)
MSKFRAKSSAAKVGQQKAQLDQARLNLSYCIITAPVGGIANKKTVEIGQNVSPGQQLLVIVPLDDIWVTADFKETQLRKMKPGQRVRFSVDAYDREYTGHVTRSRDRHWRRGGLASQPASARECDRQLREGGAAPAGSDRSRSGPE